MTIYVPGISTGPFGGPPGDTHSAVKTISDTILMELDKRRQERQDRDVGWVLSGDHGKAPKDDPNAFVDYIMSHPNLDSKGKQQALAYLSAKGQIDLQAAQAGKYRATAPEDRKEIEYWKPDGSPGGKLLVPESKYNATVDKLTKNGFIVNKVEKDQGREIEYWKPDGSPGGKLVVKESSYNDTVRKIVDSGYVVNKPQTEEAGEFERLINQLDKSKKVKPEQKDELIRKRIQKLIETGKDSDETNKITLGDGQKVTLAELRAQYREKYNIPDEFDLQMMALNPDPLVKQQATRLKAEAATKPSFVDFMMDAKENGLEGIRPGKKTNQTRIPAPPPGFVLDR